MRAWVAKQADWLLVVALGCAAVAFALYAGTELKKASGAAAAALGGATLVRAVDVLRSRAEAKSRAAAQELVSLSETRRLMFGLLAQMRSNTADPVLAATVVNSLLYNHPDLLAESDKRPLEVWKASGFQGGRNGAAIVFDLVEPRIADRERALKSR